MKKVALSVQVLLAAFWIPYYATAFARDYSRLVEFIQLKDKEKPLYVFHDFEEEFDQYSHNASLEYLNSHRDLVRKIQADLGGGKLRWKLSGLTSRLLFVPEKREDYAALFEDYCNHAIQYVLVRTQLINPYHQIETLDQPRPEISDSGVTAFVVHNLVKEYVATYTFFNMKRKKVMLELNGTVFLGTVGSYTTEIRFGNGDKLAFVRNHYTIWQNSARNPYTALTVPVEETLHIALRQHSERAIREQLALNSVKNPGRAARKIVKEWMAVEEAIVGGLVHVLLPSFLMKHMDNVPSSWIKADMKAKREFKRYRYLGRGIEVVEGLGYKKTIEMYSEDPSEFRSLLFDPRGNSDFNSQTITQR